MSGNHFLRSMAEPAGRGTESASNDGPTPEVHFAETVSVVTEVNKLDETPLVDVPLELTATGDKETAKLNQQLRRSASRDRDMKDEEGLVLKALPREASEEPTTAEQTNKVTEAVEGLEITPSPNTAKKRKQKTPETTSNPPDGNTSATTNDAKPLSKTRRGSAGGKKRGTNKAKAGAGAENQPEPELRRSKRTKST